MTREVEARTMRNGRKKHWRCLVKKVRAARNYGQEWRDGADEQVRVVRIPTRDHELRDGGQIDPGRMERGTVRQ